jgi:hypothetical protein
MVALADLLGPDSAIDLPLVMLAGLAEHGAFLGQHAATSSVRL